MNGWSDWPEIYRCLIIQSIFRYVFWEDFITYISIFWHFSNHTIIALLCIHNTSQLQYNLHVGKMNLQSSRKIPIMYIGCMKYTGRVSLVSGGGVAKLTETRRPVSTLQSPLPWTPLWNLPVAAASSEQHHAANTRGNSTSVSVDKLWFTIL